jgi:probable F420-dependent oxidoreductase
MQLGVHLPQVGPNATREGVLALARRAEELGFDSLWVSDHVVIPRQIEGQYPGAGGGWGAAFPVPPDWPFLEGISSLLFAAACTQRLLLGISVLVVPQRNPVLTAKMLATLDVLSGGRLIFGAGIGWMPEEFAALGVPFAERGARTEEYLRLIKALWTEDQPSFNGCFYSLEDVGFFPKPLQKPHPPIWMGGWAEAALRRVARVADGWHAGGPPQALAERYQLLRRFAEEAGRDPDAITLSVRTESHLWKAGPELALETLRRYRDIGARHVVLVFAGRTIGLALERMEGFARDLRPALEA